MLLASEIGCQFTATCHVFVGLRRKSRLCFVPLRLAPGLLIGGKLSTSDVSALSYSDALEFIELSFMLGTPVDDAAVMRHKRKAILI